jgi:hypothetical protein
MKLIPLAFAISLVASPLLAQSRSDVDAITDRWAADKQVHVTNSLRNFVHGVVGSQAPNSGVKVTPPVRETNGRVSRQIAPQTPESAQIQAATKKATEVLGQATEEAREEVAKGRPTLNLTILDGWLERFPTIHLIVQPVPPRDYNVTINGEDCPTTERGLYKVPFGRVEVRVERTGKPSCLWNGQLVDGRTQEVACNF